MILKQFCLLCFVVLAIGLPIIIGVSEQNKFVGWQGEDQSNHKLKYYNNYSEEYNFLNRPPNGEHKTVTLSWEPRVILHHNFLTEEECDHIIDISKTHLHRSGVVDRKTGGSTRSKSRTSEGAFLVRAQDDVVKRIEEKIAIWSMIPAENGESLQVLRYEKAQKYDAHFDYFFNKEGKQNGGNRMATVLMYLSDIEEGGETVFPKVPPMGYQTKEQFSECAMQGMAVQPYKGLAILFYSIQPTGELDYGSIHGGCPVINGTKWSATKWIHVGEYSFRSRPNNEIHPTIHVGNNIDASLLPPNCKDRNDSCVQWSEYGYCTQDPQNMIELGTCLRSCNRCDLYDQMYPNKTEENTKSE